MGSDQWPDLNYSAWRDTAATLQLWMQMVGKVRLAHEPWLNHSWHVPLYVTARGLGTSVIHSSPRAFEIEFDLIDSRLLIRNSESDAATFVLAPMSVADFHEHLTAALRSIQVNPQFNGTPSEVLNPVRFTDDVAPRSYDAEAAGHWWRALLSIDRVFKRFRTGFVGKASPVHFFWGSFDLALTRFSGRAAPVHPGGIPGLPDAVTREAYDQESSGAGFWPGNPRFPEAAFYAEAYPVPAGFSAAPIKPAAAYFAAELDEWVLPYAAVRASIDPEATLLAFLDSSFAAAARLGNWDVSLECELGEPRRPRSVRDR
jgi:hypothetical protein